MYAGLFPTISLLLSKQTLWCGYSKELSHCDDSFEYPHFKWIRLNKDFRIWKMPLMISYRRFLMPLQLTAFGKHSDKRRNCSKQAISPFCHNVFHFLVIGYPFNYRDFPLFTKRRWRCQLGQTFACKAFSQTQYMLLLWNFTHLFRVIRWPCMSSPITLKWILTELCPFLHLEFLSNLCVQGLFSDTVILCDFT